jgi:hypothetical protein
MIGSEVEQEEFTSSSDFGGFRGRSVTERGVWRSVKVTGKAAALARRLEA